MCVRVYVMPSFFDEIRAWANGRMCVAFVVPCVLRAVSVCCAVKCCIFNSFPFVLPPFFSLSLVTQQPTNQPLQHHTQQPQQPTSNPHTTTTNHNMHAVILRDVLITGSALLRDAMRCVLSRLRIVCKLRVSCVMCVMIMMMMRAPIWLAAGARARHRRIVEL